MRSTTRMKREALAFSWSTVALHLRYLFTAFYGIVNHDPDYNQQPTKNFVPDPSNKTPHISITKNPSAFRALIEDDFQKVKVKKLVRDGTLRSAHLLMAFG